MMAQSQRMNVTASNLANAESVSGPDGEAYRARQVVFELAAPQGQDIGGVKVLITVVPPTDAKGLREMADRFRDRLGSGVVAIGCPCDGKANLLVAITKDLTDRLRAGDVVAAMAAEVGGRGGGRPDLAQAGGPHPEALEAAMAKAKALIAAALTD
jgi:alanyl-tRNA synthetase